MGWVEGPKGEVCPQFTRTKVTHSLDANDADLIANAPTDLRALLDEVERLTAREEANEHNPCRLIDVGDGGMSRERAEADAFRRGAEAMRESAAQRCEVSPIHGQKTSTARRYADAVRALPIPEDKP
jgi:hypothetical protein